MIYNRMCLLGFGIMAFFAGLFYMVCAIWVSIQIGYPVSYVSVVALVNSLVAIGAGVAMFVRYYNVRNAR